MICYWMVHGREGVEDNIYETLPSLRESTFWSIWGAFRLKESANTADKAQSSHESKKISSWLCWLQGHCFPCGLDHCQHVCSQNPTPACSQGFGQVSLAWALSADHHSFLFGLWVGDRALGKPNLLWFLRNIWVFFFNFQKFLWLKLQIPQSIVSQMSWHCWLQTSPPAVLHRRAFFWMLTCSKST